MIKYIKTLVITILDFQCAKYIIIIGLSNGRLAVLLKFDFEPVKSFYFHTGQFVLGIDFSNQNIVFFT